MVTEHFKFTYIHKFNYPMPENIGDYQREMIYLSGGRISEMQQVILKLYGATPHRRGRLTWAPATALKKGCWSQSM